MSTFLSRSYFSPLLLEMMWELVWWWNVLAGLHWNKKITRSWILHGERRDMGRHESKGVGNGRREGSKQPMWITKQTFTRILFIKTLVWNRIVKILCQSKSINNNKSSLSKPRQYKLPFFKESVKLSSSLECAWDSSANYGISTFSKHKTILLQTISG